MKRLLFAAALALAGGGLASASVPELFIVTGGTAVTVIGVGSTVSFSSANFGGWELDLVFGKTNSPTLSPFGLDLTTLSEGCVGGGTCADLHVWLTAVDFAQSESSFTSAFSSTQTGTNASSSQRAWVGLGNTLFESNGADGPPTVTGGTPISTVGPFNGPGAFAGSQSAAIKAGPAAYSLTIEDIFKGCSGTSCASYSTDGNITGGVPEPASVALFGMALALCASRLRKRKTT